MLDDMLDDMGHMSCDRDWFLSKTRIDSDRLCRIEAMWPLAVELLYVEMVLICRKNGGHGTGLQPCESGSSPEGCDQWREMRNRRPGTQLPFSISFNIFQYFSMVNSFSVHFRLALTYLTRCDCSELQFL